MRILKPPSGLQGDSVGKCPKFIGIKQKLKRFLQHVTENLMVEITVAIVMILFQ